VRPRAAAAQHAAGRRLPEAIEWLTRWLEVPSVSGDPAHRADVERAARMAARRLAAVAPLVQVRRTPHGPAVLARCPGRGERAGAVVVYGHLDVKPAGPGWSGPAFRPRRVGPGGRRLVARGASDDKGQVLAHLVALEAWVAAGGPPRDVIVVLDGAEEIGSPGLRELLEAGRRAPVLAGPVAAVVVSDTRLARPGVPSLTVSQRGLLGLRVRVDAGGPAVHAGRLGGAVLDPSLVLAAGLARAERAVAALASPGPAVAGPGSDAVVRRAAGGRAVQPGDLVLRTTRRGSLTVTSLRAGGPPGAVPRSAEATLDVRIPPGVPTGTVRSVVTRALTAGDVGPLRTVVSCVGATAGFSAQHPPALLAAVRRAGLHGFGHAPVLIGSGGSIPAVVALRGVFGVDPLLLGLGPVDDGAHGPDEYLDLDDWQRGVHTSIRLLEEIPAKSRPSGSGGHGPDSGRDVVTHRAAPDSGRAVSTLGAERSSGLTQTFGGTDDRRAR